MRDAAVAAAIAREEERQKHNIELIASENYTSMDVREAVGSCLTNKYAEGYPGKRYYGGCENVDVIENLARDRVCALFGAEHANVQPHSGAQANMSVYRAALKPGDRVMGMALDAGGHLTHGYKVNFSGCDYTAMNYGVDPETEMINYEKVRQQALEFKPKLLIAGASAYARTIDFVKFREIADECGALFMADMAHIAGLVAAGLHPNPVPYADFVTSTTHKTLRGPRGGFVLCRNEYAAAVDKAVFPGMQGGPLCHVIAGKAVCFYEAAQPEFKEYAAQVIRNAAVLGEGLKEEGFRLVSGGTDNHMVLVDTRSTLGLTGRQVETALDRVRITVNKNSIPFDTEKPMHTSGFRAGSAAMTTRGFKEDEFRQVAKWIGEVCRNYEDEALLERIRQEVTELTSNF